MSSYFLKRTNQILLFIVLTGFILYFAKAWLIPLTLGGLLAMLLLPVCRWFEKRKIPRVGAVALSVLLLILIVAGFMILFISQITRFSDDLPAIEAQARARLGELQSYLDEVLNIPPEEQIRYLSDTLDNLFDSIGLYARMVIRAISQSLLFFFIIVVYAFLILLYRWRIAEFILQLMPQERQEETRQVLQQSVDVAASYLAGVLIVVSILSTINSIGLLLLDIPNAIFFGILAGVLNIIPYIGSFLGSVLPVIFALLMYDSIWIAVTVAALFIVMQSLESYLLTPNITGSKVSLNPLSTIAVLLLGQLLWGIAGIIMFIPLLGITKVIMDNVSWLRPLGLLIGNRNRDKE